MQFNEQEDLYFNFAFTNDGSVGLYNKDVGDVYHSVYGAREEAEDKFISPLNFRNNFFKQPNINVLDICYGIGYNTKALLKRILQEKYQGNLHVDILEYDKNLVTISPFIVDGYFKKYPEISYILANYLIDSIYENRSSLFSIINNCKNFKYIEQFYMSLIKKYHYFRYSYNPCKQNKSFLHNIYYHCISRRNKKAFKGLKIKNFSLNTYFDDARKSIKQLNKLYDIIFLDAFTPSKLPTLWTLEFFNELYRLISDNGMLVTYSNSAAVRHAMLDAGFFVGKLFDKNNRHCGTVASKNCSLIKHPLDDYDLGLINTRAGIYFRDKNLDLTAEEIIENYNNERNNSLLESSSQYIKRHKMEKV